MNCYKCDRPFDAETFLPKLLPRCGHTICSACLGELLNSSASNFKCPFDSIVYSKSQEFPDNLQFLEQAKQKSSERLLCRKHDKKLELFCHNCQETLCSDCALFAGHKTHDVEHLASARRKVEQKIKTFRQKMIDAKKAIECRSHDLALSVENLKKDKMSEIERGFAELSEALLTTKNSVMSSLGQFYDKLCMSLTVVRTKLNEVEAKVLSTQIEEELAQNPSREKFYQREIEQIEETLNSKLMLNARQQQDLISLSFDRTIFRTSKSYCKLIFNSDILNSAEKSKRDVDLLKNDEENLLHESFRDALKNATESLFNEEVYTVEESMRYKQKLQGSPTPHNYISEIKNYSPLSGVSQKSGQSGIRQGGGRSMLKNTPQPPGSVPQNNFTQKKSLNNFETEDTHSRKMDNMSPTLIRNMKPSETTSMRSGSTLQNNVQSLYQHSEKENLTGSQANAYTVSSKAITIDQINAILDSQMKNRSDTIDLSGLGLMDNGMEILLKRFAELKTGRTLKLNNNRLTDHGLRKILREIKGLKFEYIDFAENNISETVLDYLISFHKYNSILKAVNIRGNPISKTSPTVPKKLKLLDEQKILVMM